MWHIYEALKELIRSMLLVEFYEKHAFTLGKIVGKFFIFPIILKFSLSKWENIIFFTKFSEKYRSSRIFPMIFPSVVEFYEKQLPTLTT